MAVFAGLGVLVTHQASIGQTSPAAAAAPAPAPTGKTEADGVIFERQQLMLQISADAKTLGMIVAGTAPSDKLAATTRSIAQAAKDSVTAFEAPVPGGRSKPEVWSNHDAFMADMRAFATNTEAMAKAGEAGNMAEVTNLMVAAMPCSQCHQRYRGPKPT
jgi:cytochrome c556